MQDDTIILYGYLMCKCRYRLRALRSLPLGNYLAELRLLLECNLWLEITFPYAKPAFLPPLYAIILMFLFLFRHDPSIAKLKRKVNSFLTQKRSVFNNVVAINRYAQLNYSVVILTTNPHFCVTRSSQFQ